VAASIQEGRQILQKVKLQNGYYQGGLFPPTGHDLAAHDPLAGAALQAEFIQEGIQALAECNSIRNHIEAAQNFFRILSLEDSL